MGKIENYLGFAIKAGKLLYGIDNVEASKKRKYLLIICKTASENLVKSAYRYAEKNNIPIIQAERVLEEMIYKSNCKLIAVQDSNLAKAMIETVGR